MQCYQSAALDMSANLENPAMAIGLEKVNPHPSPQEGNTKECSSHWTIALMSPASKVMSQVLHARLQHYMNRELLDVQAGFRKGRNQRSNCQHSLDHRESKGISRKISTSVSLTMLKPLTVWITRNSGKFLKRWKYQITLPASRETWMQAKKQQLELDMVQWGGSKLGKEYVKVAYCHPVYLTYMQRTSWEMLGWMKHKVNQDCWEKYQ